MMFSDPRGGSEHGHRGENKGNDAPGKNSLRSVQGNTIPERENNRIDIPSNAGGSAARVNAADVLKKRSEEDAAP